MIATTCFYLSAEGYRFHSPGAGTMSRSLRHTSDPFSSTAAANFTGSRATYDQHRHRHPRLDGDGARPSGDHSDATRKNVSDGDRMPSSKLRHAAKHQEDHRDAAEPYGDPVHVRQRADERQGPPPRRAAVTTERHRENRRDCL